MRRPSIFGRLVRLASQRACGVARAEAQRDTFREWLRLSVEEQTADLQIFLEHFDVDRSAMLAHWASVSPHLELIPAGAHQAERDRYFADFEAVLEALGADSE